MRDLSLHILDIVQNSIKAAASVITIRITANREQEYLILNVSDNGTGMDRDFLNKVEDPFVTSRLTRKVGLGIPLLKESAIKCGGKFDICSQKNIGTTLSAAFLIDHIDRLPLGDVGDTMALLISSNTGIRFILIIESRNGYVQIDTDEINRHLDGVSIAEHDVLQWVKEYINECVINIFGGVLNEVDS